MKTQIRKTIICLAAILGCCGLGFAQNAATFTTELKPVSDSTVELIINATIEDGFHLYTSDTEGTMPASVGFDALVGAELDGDLQNVGEVHSEYEEAFEATTRYFVNKGQYVQRIKLTDPENYKIEGYFEAQACQEGGCYILDTNFSFAKGAAAAETAAAETAAAPAQVGASSMFGPLWEPVTDIKAYGGMAADSDAAQKSLWMVFILGFGGGLLALLTPCVWPIIPMTVSFFLKRSSSRSRAVRDAIIYGISIIVIYLALGIFVTAVFGADALNALSTNAIFNIIFFLMLVVFAASFFGAFEITLPSSWSNAMDSKAESTAGLVSIFFMAFTLALVSFSCTGPIIGVLLVEVATSGNWLAPAVGMFGFALALALPFSLFALFPSMLKSVPRSGGWMNTVKVVLAFVELALSLKFLSVADLAYGWGILNRDTFVALWIVIFGTLGLYLLGFIKFPHDDELDHISVPRYFLAVIVLSFTVYMVPGMWGAPCSAISAFAPPVETQEFNLVPSEVLKYDDYDEGMRVAKEQGKPVFLDFTGWGCVNCREMETAVLHKKEIEKILNEDYVCITLYVDEKGNLPQTIETPDGKKLRTVGNKWSYLQSTKFGVNAQPYYVLLDNEGKPMVGSYGYDDEKSVEKFEEYLKAGIEEYKKR